MAVLVVTPTAAQVAAATDARNEGLRPTMDRVFGPGKWRPTSGYRSRAKEDQLRREGAGTVPPGRISRHSVGSPAAPGAYDAVVYGVSQRQAAVMLRRDSGGAFRVLAEGAHGAQGPHLHIEPAGVRTRPSPPKAAVACNTIYVRIVRGRRNPLLASCSAAPSD
jgi:hypothetical protein